MTRRVGRPRRTPDETVRRTNVALSSDDRERLERLAEREQVSASEVVRRALVLYEQATKE